MKRIMITIAAMLTACIAFAQNEVSLESGNLDVLKEKKTATIKFDYSKAMVGEKTLKEYLKSKGGDYLKDWPQDQLEAGKYFTDEFNRRKGFGLRIRESESVKKADYEITVEVLYYNPGNAVAKNIPLVGKGGAVTISGFLNIIDKSSGDNVCKIAIDEVKGASYPTDATRIGFTYIALIRKIEELLD